MARIRNKQTEEKIKALTEKAKSAEKTTATEEKKDARFKASPIQVIEEGMMKPLRIYIDIVFATDNTGILENVTRCKELLLSIEKLALIIAKKDYQTALDKIRRNEVEIYKTEDKVTIDFYINNIKRLTLLMFHIVYSSCKQILESKKKSILNLTDLAEDMKEVKLGLELSDDIPKVDLTVILKDLTKFFPELNFNLPTQQKSIIEPRLFQSSNLTKTSTSLVLDAVVAVMVSGKVSQKKIKNKHFYTKDYKIGSINIVFDLTLEALQQQYGIEDGLESIKVLEALLCHWYQRKNVRGDKIRISGNDILHYLDMKYKNYRGTRCRKYENLKWLLNHCRLLKKIDVCSGIQGITPKNKKPFSIGQETSLIEINLITNPIQLDLSGEEDLSTLKDLIIEFKAGDWFKFFDHPEGIPQYGYLHQASFSSRGMQSALLTILPIKLRQTQSGQFKIKTLLEESGYREQYEEILTEPDSKIRATKAKNFKRDFDKAIKEIQTIEDPYSISYHHSTPEWVSTRKKKPNDWFSLWLDVTLQIREPQCLDTKAVEVTQNKPVKQNKPVNKKQSKLTIENLKEAMTENDVSLRPLAKIYGVSYSWLQRRLKEDNFNQTQLKDLINQCRILGKKNK